MIKESGPVHPRSQDLVLKPSSHVEVEGPMTGLDGGAAGDGDGDQMSGPFAVERNRAGQFARGGLELDTELFQVGTGQGFAAGSRVTISAIAQPFR